MAITIHQSPEDYTPSDNPVTWVFSSNQTAQANFYFLVEVEVGLSSFSKVEEHRIYPEQGIYAHFDASIIAERYAEVMSLNSATNTGNVPNYNRIRLTVTEYYGTTPSAGASTSTGNVYVFKSRLTKREFLSYDSDDYKLVAPDLDSKFLTLFPRTEKYYAGENESLWVNHIVNGNYGVIEVFVYDSSGSEIDSDNTAFVSSTDLIKSFDISKQGILGLLPGLDFTGASYWTVQIQDLASPSTTASSELFTVYLDEDNCYDGATRLYFLNSLGGFDSFTFKLFKRESYNVTSFGYERQYGGFNDSNAYVYDLQEGSVVDYLKKFDRQLTLTSDWLPEGIQNWLSKELYTSPIVYIEEGGDFYRCKVTNRTFDTKIQENDMLFQEVVTLQLETDLSVNV